MSDEEQKKRRSFTEAARAAAMAARAAKRAAPDLFGEPELFITRSGKKGFTWELRRFGGVLLTRGEISYANQPAAEAAGREALSNLRETIHLPSFERQGRPSHKAGDRQPHFRALATPDLSSVHHSCIDPEEHQA